MRLVPLLGRRVPAYISMPIIAACAAAGFIASGMHSGKTTTGARQTDPPVERTRATAATPTVGEQSPTSVQSLAAEASPPRDPLSIASASTDEMMSLPEPTPGSTVPDQEAKAADETVTPAPVPASSPAMNPKPQQTRETRRDRRAANARRPQQRVGAPSSTASVKNIPIFGPVFSLFQ